MDQMNRLSALYAANRGKGLPFAAKVSGEEMILEVYDVILSSEADAGWLGGGVGADAFARAVRDFSGDKIIIRINSPGGDVFGGVAMAAAIRDSKAEVTAYVDGYAASAASLLVAAADKAVIAPGGMVMIHKAWTLAMGNSDDMMATAALLEKIDGQLAGAYREKAGDKQDWEALMRAETWFTADEAVAIGLVDSLAARAEKPKALAFDLSAYERAPKEEQQLPSEPVVASLDPEIERRRNRARLAAASPL